MVGRNARASGCMVKITVGVVASTGDFSPILKACPVVGKDEPPRIGLGAPPGVSVKSGEARSCVSRMACSAAAAIRSRPLERDGLKSYAPVFVSPRGSIAPLNRSARAARGQGGGTPRRGLRERDCGQPRFSLQRYRCKP